MPLLNTPQRFQQLRWKLSFSFIVVTIIVDLALIAVGIIIFSILTPKPLKFYEEITAARASEARPFLETPLPDPTLLDAWLRAAISDGEQTAIVNTKGELLAANNQEFKTQANSKEVFRDPIVPEQSREVIDWALEGDPKILGIPDGMILVAQPILDEGNEVLGVLYLRGYSETLIPDYILTFVIQTLGVGVLLTIGVGILGALFGRLTSRGLVRRLENLNKVTEAWGQGDFSVMVNDASQDEIGLLTRRMNLMAEQIQDLLKASHDLAALEERNRLARDLHDSVKQQVFATTMNLGTAKTLRDQDSDAAWKVVDEALDLSYQTQQELTGLIHELRPVALESQGLAAALQEHCTKWSRQTGIEVSVAFHGDYPIPPEVEQAYFRIAQEALANVAKHSGAKNVEITINSSKSAIIMGMTDDGCGFDPATVTGDGLGLHSMRERIEALGGELIVESELGKGTNLVARCKLE